MKTTTVICDHCSEPVNAEWLEMKVCRTNLTKVFEPSSDGGVVTKEVSNDDDYDLCGTEAIHPKLAPYFHQVMTGELTNIKISVTKKTR